MKRIILLGCAALGIIGTLSFSIAATKEGERLLKPSIEYLVGDETTIGEVKIKSEFFQGSYGKKTVIIDNKGLKEEPLKFRGADERYVKDKRLFRGMISYDHAEGDGYSVVIGHKNRKGLFLRYKHEGVYKEFYITDKPIQLTGGFVKDAFIRDGEVYAVYESTKAGNTLIRINLKSEALVERIKLDEGTNIDFINGYLSKDGYKIQDNKLYMAARVDSKEKEEYIKIFCYDFISKTITTREIKSVVKGNIRLKEGKLYSSSFNPKENIEITSYDIISGEKKVLDFALPKGYPLNDVYILTLEERGDSFYLVGVLEDSKDNRSNFIMTVNKETKLIKYFAKFEDNFNVGSQIVID